MPTVIDSFVAEFALDPADFEKGSNAVRLNLKRVREDAGTTGKDMELFGKRGASMLSQLRNEAVGLFLAFQGASSVKGFVSDLLTGDAATGRLAGNIGVATNTLSAWQLAVQNVGGDAKEADAALSGLSQALQSYKLTGTTGHDADFRGLGVRLEDLQDPVTAMLKLAEAAERMPKQEFFERMHRLGMSDGVINLLERGRAATEALVEAKKKEGAATDADAAAAQRLQDKLATFKSKLLGETRPAVYGLVDALDKVDEKIGLANIAIPILIGGVGALGVAATIAAAPWIALAAAIGSAVAFYETYRRVANRDVQDVDFKDATGDAHAQYTSGSVISARTGKPVDAETLRQINSGARKGGQTSAAAGEGGGNFPAKAGNGTRAERNNNPGNIEDGAFARRQPGYAGGDGRFAKFLSPEHGAAAMTTLLRGYMSKGRDTIASIVAKWAPGHENNTGAYIAAVERATGLNRNQHLAPAQIGSVAAAMARHEGYGRNLPRLASSGGRGGGGGGVTIGTIVVNAPHSDPKRVAEAIPDAMRRRGTVAQANKGMS